ncbi:MAG: transmembrane anchor protein [Halomonas sp.]|nr:transmembrane anchor protein [Halomonas sp.]
MYNTDLPTRAELPSTGKLLRSTLLAAVIAIVLLVTVVLPAEYAIDPTGAGRLLGLTEMGEIKTQLAEEAELDQANNEAAAMQASQPTASQETVSDNQPSVATAAAPQASVVESEQVASSVPAQEMIQPEANEALPDASAAEQASSQATEEAARWGDEVTFTLTPGEGTEYHR